MTNEQLTALRSAAQAKGRPLTDAERDAALQTGNREALRLRFANVVKIAGYSPEAVEKIVAEYFPRYIDGGADEKGVYHPPNIPEFIKMCESYEQRKHRD